MVETKYTAVEISTAMWESYAKCDKTMAEVGEEFGVSRQRVHQCLYQATDPENIREVYEARRFINQKLPEPKVLVDCIICGAQIRRSRTSNTHALCATHGAKNLRGSLLRIVNETRWRQTQQSAYKWHKKNNPDITFSPPSEDADANSSRRWLVKGSQTYKIACEAIEKDWPMVEKMPASIVEQIKVDLELS